MKLPHLFGWLKSQESERDERARVLSAAVAPVAPIADRLGPDVVRRLAAAIPSGISWQDSESAERNLDDAINQAKAPIRFRSLWVAERFGAAGVPDACSLYALWGWEVFDPTWRAALDAIDVAPEVVTRDAEGVPVPDAWRAMAAIVVELARASVVDLRARAT